MPSPFTQFLSEINAKINTEVINLSKVENSVEKVENPQQKYMFAESFGNN